MTNLNAFMAWTGADTFTLEQLVYLLQAQTQRCKDARLAVGNTIVQTAAVKIPLADVHGEWRAEWQHHRGVIDFWHLGTEEATFCLFAQHTTMLAINQQPRDDRALGDSHCRIYRTLAGST
jgi:hypothetical protein